MTIEEMVREFHEVAGSRIGLHPGFPDDAEISLRESLLKEEVKEYLTADNIISLADAIGDIVYVVVGTAISFGIPFDKVFEEIHRSNMTKAREGLKDEKGKLIKGSSYEPPDIRKIIYDRNDD